MPELPPIPESLPLLARKLIGLPGRWVPYAVQKPGLAFLLNETLRMPLQQDELAFLEYAVVAIRVDDLNLDWRIRLEEQRLMPVNRDVPVDVSISGNGDDFARLTLRLVDPDTLFFQRRIRIEGDTELGLGIKNTLDALDWDDLPFVLRIVLENAGRVAQRFTRARDAEPV